MAAWEQPDVDHFHGPMLVWANRLSPGLGWGDPTLVERRVTAPEQIDPVLANLAPDVAVSSTGESVDVWAAREVFARVSSDGRAWFPPERLDALGEPQSPFVKQLRVAAGARGRFVAAWANGADGRVAWREPSSGWSPATSFRVGPGLVMDGPRLWIPWEAGPHSGSGGTTYNGRLDPQEWIGRVALAANDRGEALVAWTRYEEGIRGKLWTSRLRVP
jgi:hypothetical protein